MTEYHFKNFRFSDLQLDLNKSKSQKKKKEIGVTLRLLSCTIATNETNFPHNLLLSEKISSKDIKLSKIWLYSWTSWTVNGIPVIITWRCRPKMYWQY